MTLADCEILLFRMQISQELRLSQSPSLRTPEALFVLLRTFGGPESRIWGAAWSTAFLDSLMSVTYAKYVLTAAGTQNRVRAFVRPLRKKGEDASSRRDGRPEPHLTVV